MNYDGEKKEIKIFRKSCVLDKNNKKKLFLKFYVESIVCIINQVFHVIVLNRYFLITYYTIKRDFI